jgi:UDP-N-acetylglucosamine 4-epimerase
VKPVPTYRDFRPGDVRFSKADISKIESRLGYKPIFRAREGLAKATAWYVARLGPQAARKAQAITA